MVRAGTLVIQAEKFRRCDWLRPSLFPRNSGMPAKNGWYNKVTMTTLNTVTFLLSEVSGEEIQKFAVKAVNRSQNY